jgi:hypothetical protein
MARANALFAAWISMETAISFGIFIDWAGTIIQDYRIEK